MKSHPFKLTSVIAACAVLAACSSAGPKPDQPNGEVRKANTQPETLAELIDITRAGMPRRFRAERDTDLQEVLRSWTQTAGMTLQWTSAQRLSTTGGIDEIDIRAALMSLAAQFRSDQAALTLEFITPKVLRVSDVKTSELGCAMVPAGALALGRFCLASAQAVEPATKLIPESASNQTPPPTTQAARATTTPIAPLPETQPTAAQNLAAQQPLSAQALEAPSPPLFSIESGQRLSVALQAWLAAQGVGMVWDVSAGGERLRDIEMISEWRASSPDIEKTLAQLLPPFGLRAIVQDNPRVVIVRSASGSAVKTTGAAK